MSDVGGGGRPAGPDAPAGARGRDGRAGDGRPDDGWADDGWADELADELADEWADGEVGATWYAAAPRRRWAAVPASRVGRGGGEPPDPVRRTIRLAAVAAVAVVAAIGVAGIRAALDDGEDAGAGDGTVAAGASTSVPVTAAPVGPAPGEDVPGYLAGRHAAVVALPPGERRAAVVSLASYRPVAGADEVVLAEAPDAEIVAHLVAVRGGAPARVDGPVQDWIESVRPVLQAERDGIAELLPTVTDAEFVAFYEQELARLDTVLAALDPAGDLVFAVVVVADGAALGRLSLRPDVRLVDVAPAGEVATATGVRPEELAVAGDPPFRP